MSRSCPICRTSAEQARLFLDENFDAKRLSALSYASRKTPEFMCLRMLQCPKCDLVYAETPPMQSELAKAYELADYDSSQEANDAASTYVDAISPILQRLPERRSALEIGAGTGIFLECLKERGFVQLSGVEPSAAALAAAPEHRRAWIREGIFEESEFAPGSFDLVCCFMTLEHVFDPAELVAAAWRLLRPGGAFVSVTHDYRGFLNRLLGRHSPIVDIEHMQLFSPRSIEALFERGHYRSVGSSTFRNSYALRYWLRLAPLPGGLKTAAGRVADKLGLASRKLSFNVGNTLAWGFKPATAAPAI